MTGLQDVNDPNCLKKQKLNSREKGEDNTVTKGKLSIDEHLPSHPTSFCVSGLMSKVFPLPLSIPLQGATVLNDILLEKRRFQILLAPCSLDLIKGIASFIAA